MNAVEHGKHTRDVPRADGKPVDGTVKSFDEQLKTLYGPFIKPMPAKRTCAQCSRTVGAGHNFCAEHRVGKTFASETDQAYCPRCHLMYYRCTCRADFARRK